jgi:hypothetical protein
MSSLLIAVLAFAGASVAQLVSHILFLRRAQIEKHRQTIAFTHALIAEVDHASKVLATIIAFLKTTADFPPQYKFDGDPIVVQFTPQVLEKYDYSLLIYPQTIYRVSYFMSQVKPICDIVTNPQMGRFTEAGHRLIVGLLRYGLSLSCRLERSLAQGSIDKAAAVTDDEVLAYYSKFRFPGGGTHLTIDDLKRLFERYPEIRF